MSAALSTTAATTAITTPAIPAKTQRRRDFGAGLLSAGCENGGPGGNGSGGIGCAGNDGSDGAEVRVGVTVGCGPEFDAGRGPENGAVGTDCGPVKGTAGALPALGDSMVANVESMSLRILQVTSGRSRS